MCGGRKVRKTGLTAAASLLTLALVALPVAPSLDGVSLDGMAAYAKGGNGGGNAGGKGGKGGQNASTLVDPEADSHGKGHTGTGLGHSKDAVSGVHLNHNGSHPDNHGALTSLLGSLNAAHAMANGNTNDNLNSKVGQIREYMDLFNDFAVGGVTTVGEVADALITASNKDLESMDTQTVEDVVGGVNELLGDDITASGIELENAEEAVAEEISPTP